MPSGVTGHFAFGLTGLCEHYRQMGGLLMGLLLVVALWFLVVGILYLTGRGNWVIDSGRFLMAPRGARGTRDFAIVSAAGAVVGALMLAMGARPQGWADFAAAFVLGFIVVLLTSSLVIGLVIGLFLLWIRLTFPRGDG